MAIIGWILVGGIAGLLAAIVARGRAGRNGSVLVGVVGGLLGGLTATQVLRIGAIDRLDAVSVELAIVGAVALLLLWRGVTNRRPALRF